MFVNPLAKGVSANEAVVKDVSSKGARDTGKGRDLEQLTLIDEVAIESTLTGNSRNGETSIDSALFRLVNTSKHYLQL